MTARAIDLNCDLGESPDRVRNGTDAQLLDCVTSANIACGGHAGDEATMTETVRAAIARGVAIGAHPGYPDREGFGRVELAMRAEEIRLSVADQIRALDRVARAMGAGLTHVKPHGALYHAAMTKPLIASAIADACRKVSPGIVLVGLAGAPALGWWRAAGFRVASEAFADRRYEADGSLRSRAHADSLIIDPALAAAQAVDLALGRGVVAVDGACVPIRADTVCIHSDTPGAVSVARAVRAALASAGFALASLAAVRSI